jgi:hypothetical protein
MRYVLVEQYNHEKFMHFTDYLFENCNGKQQRTILHFNFLNIDLVHYK